MADARLNLGARARTAGFGVALVIVSALLFVPYALWVGFASVLNFAVAVLN